MESTSSANASPVCRSRRAAEAPGSSKSPPPGGRASAGTVNDMILAMAFERTPSAASHKRERERTREVRSPSGKSGVRLPSDQSRRPHRVQGPDLPHRAVRWSERNRGKSRLPRDPLSEPACAIRPLLPCCLLAYAVEHMVGTHAGGRKPMEVAAACACSDCVMQGALVSRRISAGHCSHRIGWMSPQGRPLRGLQAPVLRCFHQTQGC